MMVYGLCAVLPVIVDVIVNLPDETEAILKVCVFIFSNYVNFSYFLRANNCFLGSDFFVKFVITYNPFSTIFFLILLCT